MRIVSHSGGVKAPTISVVVTFDKCKKVPNFVKFGYLSFRTNCLSPTPSAATPAKPSVTPHTAVGNLLRPAPPVLVATVFFYDTCPNKSAPKFSNCGGPHSTGYSGCPVYSKAYAVTKLVTTTGMSYRDAGVKRKATPVVGAPLQLPSTQSPMEVVDLSGPPLQLQMIPHPFVHMAAVTMNASTPSAASPPHISPHTRPQWGATDHTAGDTCRCHHLYSLPGGGAD